ncbi:MAG: AAA family ATPase [Bacillota bacterium]
MGMLVFGDQKFIDEFLQQPSLAIPVQGIAHDMITAANMLKTYDDAREIIIGFRNGRDFALESADLYRSKRFFLIMDREDITSVVYKAAMSRGVRVVERAVAGEAISAELGSPMGPAHERRPVDPAVAANIEQSMISKQTRPLKSHTLAITGIKGGTGKTATAVSLAAYVADWTRKSKVDYKVCLVDCDAEGARSAGIWLGIANAPQSLSVWASLDREPSWMEIEQLLIRHEKTGLYVLPGPQSFRDAFNTELTEILAERIVNALRWHFDLVVLDLGAFVKNQTAIRAMQISSKVFIVIEPTLTVLRLLEEMAKENILGELKADLSRVKLVLNMVEGCPFSQRDIERSFGIPVAVSLSLDRTVKKVENSGICIPPTLAFPNSAYSHGIAALARTATDNEMLPIHKCTPWAKLNNMKDNLFLKLKRA